MSPSSLSLKMMLVATTRIWNLTSLGRGPKMAKASRLWIAFEFAWQKMRLGCLFVRKRASGEVPRHIKSIDALHPRINRAGLSRTHLDEIGRVVTHFTDLFRNRIAAHRKLSLRSLLLLEIGKRFPYHSNSSSNGRNSFLTSSSHPCTPVSSQV